MCQAVPGQIPGLTEGAPADLTLERLVPCVDTLKQSKAVNAYVDNSDTLGNFIHRDNCGWICFHDF